MQKKIIAEIERCLQHAAESIQRASTTNDPALKASYIDMAQRWRNLADSFEMAETLGDVSAVAGMNLH
jgi:hypothetical protein